MASSFEKSVKGATKIKAAPPKTKYIEHILIATHSGEAGVGEVFRALQHRLRDSTWTVVFKSLITTHMMIREGSPDVTLAYLAKHRNMLAVSMFSDAQTQGRNIRHYSNYLSERARAYRETKCDWVRAKESRLEKLTVDKGLLRESEVVQHQITALLKCDVMDNEPENEITVTVFRLLVLDLLALFQVLNHAMINILGQFFEMSKTDADRAMEIYRTFTKQTDFVVQYLSVAKQYEHHTRVEVPKLKYAPVNLGRQLEEYLRDPDFEVNRRQYLAEHEAKKGKGGSGGGSSRFFKSETPSKNGTSKAFSNANANGSRQASRSTQPSKGPDTDLIDFFDSIEPKPPVATQPQMPVQNGMNPFMAAANPYAVQNAVFVPQPTGMPGSNPFQQQNMGPFAQPPPALQPSFTGAGFGGYTPQSSFQPGALASIPQDSVATIQTGALSPFQNMQAGQQTSNPFRQSAFPTGQTGSPFQPAPVQQPAMTGQQSTNPFARSSPQPFSPTAASSSPFAAQQPSPLQPMATGTNPFAKGFGGSPQEAPRPLTAGALVPQPTGSTNPFRQGAFVDHQTGLGWQHHQQPIGGGLDQMETISVFPRPAQQSPWQQ